MTKPFWEESYRREGKLDTFGGGKPDDIVEELISKIPAGSNVLDLGCGEGRNALYLASKGFNTTAFDISQSGIDKLLLVATSNKLKINAFVYDLRDYNFSNSFDLIVSSGVLHLVSKDEWKKAINKMKNATNIKGYNSIGIFTNIEPEPEDQRGLMVGLADEGELFECYQDWEVLDTKTFSFEHQHPDGPRHRHSANRILARKK